MDVEILVVERYFQILKLMFSFHVYSVGVKQKFAQGVFIPRKWNSGGQTIMASELALRN